MTGEKIITVPNFSAGFAAIWGLCVLNPWNDVFALNPRLYGPMLSLAPAPFWGGLFVAVGIVTWMLCYFRQRIAAAFFLFVVYGMFAGLYWLGDYRSPGGPIYAYTSIVHFIYGLWGVVQWKQHS